MTRRLICPAPHLWFVASSDERLLLRLLAFIRHEKRRRKEGIAVDTIGPPKIKAACDLALTRAWHGRGRGRLRRLGTDT